MRDFALEVYFSQWEFKARYHLTASDIESMALKDVLALASAEDREKYENCWLGYTQTWGDPELRELIANTYDHQAAENILCFAGAEEGIYTAMRMMLNADDHAIVIVPNYQAAETLPLDICDVSGVALDSANGWALDIEKIKQAIRPNTKLISVNFPNNPTGYVPPRNVLEELVSLCRENGIWLFSDEVYRGVEINPDDTLPQVADIYEKGLSLNVMSKAYGLPGLRVGWIACQDTDLLCSFERYKHYLSICNSAVSEKLSIIALKAKDQIIAKNRGLIGANLKVVEAFFEEFSDLFDWQRPKGSCVAFPAFKGNIGVEAFCKELVEETGVLFLPASIYKSELLDVPKNHFRIGFGRTVVPEGLAICRDFISRNRNRL